MVRTMFWSALEAVLGVGGLLSVLLDVFQFVVTPRPVAGRFRLSRYLIRSLWWVVRRLSYEIHNVRRRESLLGSFGPFAVVALLVMWVVGLVVGYGLLLDTLRDELRPHPTNLLGSLYFAATSLLTIGFGDFVATQPLARFISLAAGATGLALFALVITFLFSLFAAFQRRKVAVVTLE